MAEAILRVTGLTMRYATRKGWVNAVEDVTFSLAQGESLGLVGESGCGKTSIALCLLRVLPDNARIFGGAVSLSGVDLLTLGEEEMRRYRSARIAMISQAAMSSLSPVHRVGDQVVEVIEVHRGTHAGGARARARELFEMVGLEPAVLDRYPHELSGGMRQRTVIAMALSCNPDVIVADEPTTALDVIVQARVLEQMRQVQRQLGTAMIYISHDIGVIAQVCDRIAVMYAGKIVEMGPTDAVFRRSVHPYARSLMTAFPRLRGPKRELISLPGEPPDLISPPTGCRFHPRCANATEVCMEQPPPWRQHGDDHMAACWHPLDGTEGGAQ